MMMNHLKISTKWNIFFLAMKEVLSISIKQQPNGFLMATRHEAI